MWPSGRPNRAVAPQARLLCVLALMAITAACAPFQRGTPEPTPASPGTAALAAAESRIGSPYRYGGTGPDAFDCSGLVAYAYRQAGISMPRTAAQQYAIARPVPRGELRAGDLVFFRLAGREVSHVGIYAGDARFVHAPQSGGTVRLASLDDDWYRERYAGAGRPY